MCPLYTSPGATQARTIAREAQRTGNHRRWRLAALLMRNAMRIQAAQEAAR